MRYIPQIQLLNLKKKVQKGKVVIIYGPRRVGKTTLIRKYLEKEKNYLLISGEDKSLEKTLNSLELPQLKSLIGSHSLLVIDEAQKVENIGLCLKLMVDHIDNLAIIATGSSSFSLNRQFGEPLVGRSKSLYLFPISQMELSSFEMSSMTTSLLEERLIYGLYPEVLSLSSKTEKRDYLRELVVSSLCRDILELDGIKKSKKLFDLLTLIAYQVGKEVSYNELALTLGLNKQTVEKYLDLLEQVFVLKNIRGLSRNLRKEVSKTSRYYFYDIGIRNAIINNFNSLSVRDDIGLLWENYLIMERLKKQHYQGMHSNNYFWRTYDQQEIDWIEERDGHYYAYEMKYSERKIPKCPKAFSNAYTNSTFQVINRDNYLSFVL